MQVGYAVDLQGLWSVLKLQTVHGTQQFVSIAVACGFGPFRASGGRTRYIEKF